MAGVRHTESFDIDRPAAELFPLFSAEGEFAWVPGWTYRNVMGTTELAEDYVFVTRSHDHARSDGDAGADAIWIVKRFEPENWRVELYRVECGDKVGLVIVRLQPRGLEATTVEVTYEYIGLSKTGDAFIEGFTAEAYRDFIGEWKTLLEDYFSRI
jgi:hypothetical protein